MLNLFMKEPMRPNTLSLRGGKKKKKNAATVTESESHSRERERVVELTSDLVENDLWLLWEPPSVQMMEDFSKLVHRGTIQ